MNNNVKTSAVSGCVIWFVLLTFIGSCVMPIALAVGSISSSSDFVIENVGMFICPEGTAPRSFSYETTMVDQNGNTQPATAYELQCEDSNGDVVQTDPILYAFIWIGIVALLGMVTTVILSFIFAVPGGMLVTRMVNSIRRKKAIQN